MSRCHLCSHSVLHVACCISWLRLRIQHWLTYMPFFIWLIWYHCTVCTDLWLRWFSQNHEVESAPVNQQHERRSRERERDQELSGETKGRNNKQTSLLHLYCLSLFLLITALSCEIMKKKRGGGGGTPTLAQSCQEYIQLLSDVSTWVPL